METSCGQSAHVELLPPAVGMSFGPLRRNDWAHSESSRPEGDLRSHRVKEITLDKSESEKNLEGPVHFKDRSISGSLL